MKKYLFIVILAVITCHIFAQNSVSIGTEEINENAVLQLVSQNNNQGFLVPRLTALQREAIQLNTATDNGMLVYDTDEDSFFYWMQGSWYQLLHGPVYTAGEGIEIDENHTISNIYEADPVLIHGSGAAIVNSAGNNEFTVYVSDADTLADNEIQDLNNVLLQGNNAGNSIITGLGDPVNDNDAVTKEYVDNGLSNTWSITGNNNIGGGNYLGTTNNQNLRLRTNAQDRMIIDGNTGNLGINHTPNNQYKLMVELYSDHGTDAAICGYARGSQDIYGLRGGTFSNDDDAAGVHGFAGGNNGATYGISGVTYSTDDDAAGVYGYANRDAGGRTYGVYGVSASPNGVGIYGRGHDWAGYFQGNVYTTGTYQSSDARLKTKIMDLQDEVTNIKSIRGVSYYWNKEKYPDRGFNDNKQFGVIAQEVEKVYPELVSEDEGYKIVNYVGFIPVLIEVVKEQQEFIEEQTKEIEQLRLRMDKIENELSGKK